MTAHIPPLFIVGAPRSGNTLLRRVLLASGQIYIPPETYVVGQILSRWKDWRKLRWREKTRLIAAAFEHHAMFADFEIESFHPFVLEADALPETEQSPTAAMDCLYKFMAEQHGFTADRWGDKTPWNTMYLKDIVRTYPDAYFLYVYRDGRDVIASQVKAGMRDIDDAAYRWIQANEACRKYLDRAQRPHLTVRYEDLVRSPEKEFRRIFGWADLRFDTDFLVNIPKKLGDVGRHEHHATVLKPISDVSIGAWQKSMKAEDFRALPANFEKLMDRLGYSDV